MTIKVDLTEYKDTHGKTPRGRDLWIAAVYAEGRGWTELYYTGPWSEARARFVSEARDIGGAEVIVLQP